MYIEVEHSRDHAGLGIVETEHFTFGFPPDTLLLESGERLGPITIAYETYGSPNRDKSNVVLICHAFSGDAHATGFHRGHHKPGWWNNMIGPGKAFDTNRYFVICSNVLGGCKGSTGSSSINPRTNRPYGLDFPIISIKDMVNAQRHLIDHLGIDVLLSVAGGSMGGMQVLEWMAAYPERILSAVPIATSAGHSPQQIAFGEAGRQAIMADPDWKSGDYYGGPLPLRGLAVARMIGHVTYMSDKSMNEKFGRQVKSGGRADKFSSDFEVEEYLKDRGESFCKRFDANTYLYLTKAMDYFDLAREKPLHEVFRDITAKVLVIAFKSDWLYPAYQCQQIVKACKLAGVDVTYCEIGSSYGHDAFLLESEDETLLVEHFLNRVSYENEIC
ncbi:MAG TPA: homoserine O-acetyltransferase [Nitrospiraceae bacterium]|jgi:homoserine O-acetyltransferase|nr:homoserine O-acetyltransferase [Nitrospiraceae bacterium]